MLAKLKFIIFIFLLCINQIHATCSIDAENSVCSLPNFRENLSPVYSPKSNINEFSGTPEARLKPVDRDDLNTYYREFAPIKNELNYNSNCQFGVCLQETSKPLFRQ